MDETSGLKQYHLSTEAIEELLQAQYGSSIQPVDYKKLEKLRRQHHLQIARGILLKNKQTEITEDPPRLEELSEIKLL